MNLQSRSPRKRSHWSTRLPSSMPVKSLFAIGLFTVSMWASVPVRAFEYRPFFNPRFGTATEVPAGWSAQAESANGDGREFLGPHGSVLRVYGSYSGTGALGSLADYRVEARSWMKQDGVRMTMDMGGADWFALSGFQGSKIVYLRVVQACGATHHVNFEYDASDQPYFGPIVSHVARELRCRSSSVGRH